MVGFARSGYRNLLRRVADRREPSAPIQPQLSALVIPTSIFKDRSVAVLEAITEYLKDSHDLSYHEIAHKLNRDDRTIWTVYNRAKKKRVKSEQKVDPASTIPIEIFKDRSVAVLEAAVKYLKEQRELSYHEIAVLLGRNDRTIWTVYNRTLKKAASNN